MEDMSAAASINDACETAKMVIVSNKEENDENQGDIKTKMKGDKEEENEAHLASENGNLLNNESDAEKENLLSNEKGAEEKCDGPQLENKDEKFSEGLNDEGKQQNLEEVERNKPANDTVQPDDEEEAKNGHIEESSVSSVILEKDDILSASEAPPDEPPKIEDEKEKETDEGNVIINTIEGEKLSQLDNEGSEVSEELKTAAKTIDSLEQSAMMEADGAVMKDNTHEEEIENKEEKIVVSDDEKIIDLDTTPESCEIPNVEESFPAETQKSNNDNDLVLILEEQSTKSDDGGKIDQLKSTINDSDSIHSTASVEQKEIENSAREFEAKEPPVLVKDIEINDIEGKDTDKPGGLELSEENLDEKTDNNSAGMSIDKGNENSDSTDPTTKQKHHAETEEDEKNKNGNENCLEMDVEPIEEITEVIEIDDDDEEVVAKKQQNGDASYEDSLKNGDEQPAAAAVTNDNDNNKMKNDEVMKKTFINSEEKDCVARCSSARMRTMPNIYYNKECINFECSKKHKEFHRAPQFAMNYFKVVKKKLKVQYICGDCYDIALKFYQDLCGVLNAKQPILLRDIASRKQEFVEILDSSEEEDNGANEAENEKENESFSKTDLILIETELENAIRSTFNRVDIQHQLTWTKTIFTERVKKMQEDLEYIDAELREQQNMADRMYNNLYDSGKYRINVLKPLDIDADNSDQIPPLGEIERPPIKLGELYYGAKHKAIACWIPCRAIEQLDASQLGAQKNVPNYKVKFINTQYQTFKNLSAKLIAYYDPPSVRLLVGQRVIAYFDGSTLSPRDKDKCLVQSAFYPGIIAEEMKPNNFFRYLIFYDDGYTQYVSHKDVRLVCHVARNVWEDVDQSSREFIQKYIMEYRVNRPMVQTHKGQKMLTESNGRWVPARVIDIDCSLVRMQFEGPNKNHKEWIYRGSLRLNPVYLEYRKSKTNQASQMPISRLPRRTEPFIRYSEDEENIRGSLGPQQQQQQQRISGNRPDILAVANQAPKVRHLNANTIYVEDENRPKGKVIYYTAKRQMPTKTYIPHKCGPECLLVVPHNLNGYSPLAKPLLSGWERAFLRQKSKKRVFYRAPCGKSFRDMKELHKFLRKTKNTLNVDSFDFYPETSCLAEFEAENINLRKRDISNGQEKMPLPLVNYYDDTLPECTYSAKVIPTEGVHINTNADFLICCDCEDDCVDKEKCACWQLTIEGVRSINPDIHIDDIGYQYKRLYEHLPTGIYECNSRCKCKSHCINRVVQHSLEMKLQVFKTSNRGWGLRCLNDIPRGSFVCIYAGNLLTESKANEGGLDAGDEYFAELDYIETVEQLKEGYESDVENQEDEEDEDPYQPDYDDDFRPGRSFSNRSKRSQRQSSGDGERQAINFNPNVAIEEDTTKKKRPSVRQFFGKDEAVYVMDAKVTGNLGRYFNHSCSPNLFVQNVFVDTHDVRFPWVAFFSLNHIRAGTELTWNYNYEVGVVPGKVLYCQCGASNCRQRLL